MKKTAILYAATLASVNGAEVVDLCPPGTEDDVLKPERI